MSVAGGEKDDETPTHYKQHTLTAAKEGLGSVAR